VARNTTIALQWDEVGLQSLAGNHMVAKQDFHGDIAIVFKKAQGMEICNMDRTRPFLQKDLETRLPARETIAMVEGHFHDESMEFGNARAVHTSLVIAIVKTRGGGGGTFPAVSSG